MDTDTNDSPLRLALPKGRIQPGVERILEDAGIVLTGGTRALRPRLSLDGVEAKVLKPQAVVEMLHAGSRDAGFAGADWVEELNADVVPVLDLELDPVRIVAAAPPDLLEAGSLPTRRLVVASEYPRLTRRWISDKGLDAVCIRSFGATEVLPPEDADVIVDVVQTGSTLVANGLVEVDELLRSTTRFYASPAALARPGTKTRIDRLSLLLSSVLKARGRVMIEVNVGAAALDTIVDLLPCLRHPTVARLYGEDAYAVKAAVPKEVVPDLVCAVRENGGTDIVLSPLSRIVP